MNQPNINQGLINMAIKEISLIYLFQIMEIIINKLTLKIIVLTIMNLNYNNNKVNLKHKKISLIQLIIS
jgi:hypothetical protein